MSFLRNLFRNRSKKVNLSICGLDGVGKTTIINFLIYGEFREVTPTMALNREKIDLPKLQLNIVDLGGQQDFRSMWTSVNEKSDALIFVVDSTDILRILEAKNIFYKVLETQIHEDIPVLLLLNKVDQPDRIRREDFIRLFDLFNPKITMEWACYETSPKRGIGIYEAFRWFLKVIQDV